MALHGLIHVNRHNIGEWSAVRVVTRPDGRHTYEWTVELNGVQHVGRLTHHYDDGAARLASAVLAAYAQRQENP